MTARKKLLIYKIILFVFAFIVAFLPSTVSRSKEVNSRVIVELLGIDGGESVEITAQYVMPAQAEGGTNKDIVTVSGKTVPEAVEALNTALGRRVELGHCSMIIVGDDAKPELLGTIMTTTDITADVYLSAADGKASELVGNITDFMQKTGATDADFIAYSAKKAHVATNTILNFMSDLGSASHTAYMPVVDMIDSESKSGGGGSGEQGGGGGDGGDKSGGSCGGGEGEKGGGEQSGMRVERLALYGADGRKGILEKSAARGVAWVSAPIENGVIAAEVERGDQTVANVSGRLLKKRAKAEADANNNTVRLKIGVTVDPQGDEVMSMQTENGEKASEAIKAAFAAAVEKEIRAAFEQSADMDCDPLFIGRQFYRYAPKFFNSSYSLKTVNVEYDVTVDLK